MKKLCPSTVRDSNFILLYSLFTYLSRVSNDSKPKNDQGKITVVNSIKYMYTRMGDRRMSLEDYNMERITHVRISDHGFSVYISVCYDTMRLHAWKYDDNSIEWDSFQSLLEFSEWVQKPIKKIKH